MKVTVVPAQVTTVEDRIMGNLGFSQLMLLILPIFASALIYFILPPMMGSSIYKFVIMAIFAVLCGISAIRIKGKIVLLWAIVMARYNVRPKFYVFNKNTAAYREQYDTVKTESEEEQKDVAKPIIAIPKLDFHESAKLLAVMQDPASKLRFETTKKGGLNVRLTEIQD